MLSGEKNEPCRCGPRHSALQPAAGLLNNTMACDNEQCRQPCFSHIDDRTSRAYSTTPTLSKLLPQLLCRSRELRKIENLKQ